jgi:hypothetical protein
MLRPRVHRCALRAGLLLLALGVAAGGAAATSCCAPGPAGSPAGWLRLRTTGYFFQSVDPFGVTQDRFGAYGEFDGAAYGLAGNRVSLRLSGRFADDLRLKARTTDRSRLFVGQVEYRPEARFTARLGRQFVQEGPTGLTLDGLWLSARPDPRWEIRLWGGSRAPLSRTYKMSTLDQQGAWGARLVYAGFRDLRLSASAASRKRDGRVAARPIGMEAQLARLAWVPGLRATARVAYDLELDQLDRAEALAQWRPRPNLPVFSGQIVARRPAIDAGSYFARFELEQIVVGRVSVRYEDRRHCGAEAEYVGSFTEGRSATRLGGSLLFPYGRVGYSARLGDAGEESRWFGEANYSPLPWVRVEAGATLLTYALLDNAPESDEHDLTSAYGRVRLQPIPGVGVTLEVQDVVNPDVKHDVRFLGGLDLLAAGAAWGGSQR